MWGTRSADAAPVVAARITASLTLLLVACGAPTTEDAGGVAPDASPLDASTIDAALTDAGSRDAGSRDAADTPDASACDPACGPGRVCEAGACVCASDAEHLCDDACVDSTSPATCGARCDPCEAPEHAIARCVVGACGFECAAGYTRSGDACAPATPTGVWDGTVRRAFRNDVAVAPDGTVGVAFIVGDTEFPPTHFDVRYAERVDGVWSDELVVASTLDVGLWVELAFDASSRPTLVFAGFETVSAPDTRDEVVRATRGPSSWTLAPIAELTGGAQITPFSAAFDASAHVLHVVYPGVHYVDAPAQFIHAVEVDGDVTTATVDVRDASGESHGIWENGTLVTAAGIVEVVGSVDDDGFRTENRITHSRRSAAGTWATVIAARWPVPSSGSLPAVDYVRPFEGPAGTVIHSTEALRYELVLRETVEDASGFTTYAFATTSSRIWNDYVCSALGPGGESLFAWTDADGLHLLEGDGAGGFAHAIPYTAVSDPGPCSIVYDGSVARASYADDGRIEYLETVLH